MLPAPRPSDMLVLLLAMALATYMPALGERPAAGVLPISLAAMAAAAAEKMNAKREAESKGMC